MGKEANPAKEMFPENIYDDTKAAPLADKVRTINGKARLRWNKRDKKWDTYDSKGDIVPQFSQEEKIDGKFVDDLGKARQKAKKGIPNSTRQDNKELQRQCNAHGKGIGKNEAPEQLAECMWDRLVVGKRAFRVGIDLKAMERAKLNADT